MNEGGFGMSVCVWDVEVYDCDVAQISGWLCRVVSACL